MTVNRHGEAQANRSGAAVSEDNVSRGAMQREVISLGMVANGISEVNGWSRDEH